MNSFRLIVFLGIVLGIFILYQQFHETTHTTPKSIQIAKPTTTKSQVFTPTDDDLLVLIYPKSKVTSQSEKIITLETTDNPEDITDWYKKTLQQKKYPIKTVIQSNTNGNITDKIAGTNNTHSLSITIEKSPAEKVTQITIIIKKTY